MYTKPFYLTEPIGNNALSFDKRSNKQLFVPSLKEAKGLKEIEFWNEIVFEDFDENGILQSCRGLKNFYRFTLQVNGKEIPLFLVDNHNHVLFFWYWALHNGILKESGNTVLHIDEHADTRIPEIPLQNRDLESMFHYTNFVANVGNYMIPAQREGLIGEIFQIRDESSLERNYDVDILNLDLDFFSPRLDYIPYQKKKNFILRHIKKTHIITVCTSPFFIDENLAINVFRDILSEFIPNE